jgi:hypothetical protein
MEIQVKDSLMADVVARQGKEYKCNYLISRMYSLCHNIEELNVNQIQSKRAGRKLDLFPTENPEPEVRKESELSVENDRCIIETDDEEDQEDSTPDDTADQINPVVLKNEEKVCFG